jgi:hypothetical protein
MINASGDEKVAFETEILTSPEEGVVTLASLAGISLKLGEMFQIMM